MAIPSALPASTPQLEAMVLARCPVCLGTSFEHLTGLFRGPDQPRLFQRDQRRLIVRCQLCATVQRSPLEILAPGAVNEYGESYYDQFPDPTRWQAEVREHIRVQALHYNQLREVLRGWTDPHQHPVWLDVGSAGCPTAWEDFEFHTVEPDRRVVALGREIYRADRIHCGILETLSFDRPLDGIVYHDSFYCVPSPNEALAQARRLLRSGGLLLFRMGGPFIGARDNCDDGEYHRIEDVVRGDVKWIDYSLEALSYLCARHGFARLADVEKDQSYAPSRSSRYVLFKKVSEPPPAPPLESVRAAQEGRLAELLAGFRRRNVTTIEALHRADVALLGPAPLLLDLLFIEPQFAPGAMVNSDFPGVDAPYQLDGGHFLPIRNLASRIQERQIRHLVLASFTDLRAVAALAQRELPTAGIELYVPTRAAGEDRLLGPWRSALVPLRALVLRRARLKGDGAGHIEPGPRVDEALS